MEAITVGLGTQGQVPGPTPYPGVQSPYIFGYQYTAGLCGQNQVCVLLLLPDAIRFSEAASARSEGGCSRLLSQLFLILPPLCSSPFTCRCTDVKSLSVPVLLRQAHCLTLDHLPVADLGENKVSSHYTHVFWHHSVFFFFIELFMNFCIIIFMTCNLLFYLAFF